MLRAPFMETRDNFLKTLSRERPLRVSTRFVVSAVIKSTLPPDALHNDYPAWHFI